MPSQRRSDETRLRVMCVIGSLAGGGSERQMIGILRHLDRKRFQPLLYLVERRGELLEEVPEDVPIFSFWQRHRYLRLNFPGRIHRLQVRDLTRLLQQEHADVLYDRNYFATLIAAPAARRAAVPRLSTIVGDPALHWHYAAERFAWIKRPLLRQAYRSAYRVISVSEDVRQAAIHYYRLDPQHVVSVPNFVDLERVDRLRRCQQGLPAGRFHIVTTGRLHPEKGHKYLLEAIAELVHRRQQTHVQWHVLGQGPTEQELRQQVKAHALEQHVRFYGFVQNPFCLLQSAQVFCLPSLFDGLPNALLEAMACQVPVLVTDCPGGMRELLQGGQLGHLVPAGDAPALAAALSDAIAHYERWRAMAEPAREHLERTLSPAASMAKLEPLLMAAARNRAS